MIRTIVAYTYEIDDVKTAVAQILEQLDLGKNLLTHSVGLINCYAEFIESGVVKALCDKLPFDTVGITTLAAACENNIDQMILTLTLLTSDDVFFSAGCTTSLDKEQTAPIYAAGALALKKLEAAPKLMLAYAPLIQHVGGDVILKAISDAGLDVPVFGTLAVDHNIDYRMAQVIYNGNASKENMAFVLTGGNISPKFFVESGSESKVLNQKSIITASEGNVLKEVNNMPVVSYLETLGIEKDKQVAGANVIPFIVDYNDGTKPVVRAIFATTEEGYSVCGGAMPVNATLSIGSIDHADVLAATEKMASEILKHKFDFALIFSCVGRFFVQGADFLSEMNKLNDSLKNKRTYQMCYSGGEICPMVSSSGKIYNRFHNYTMVVCLL